MRHRWLILHGLLWVVLLTSSASVRGAEDLPPLPPLPPPPPAQTGADQGGKGNPADGALKTTQQEVGTWFQAANQLWNQYKQEPITSDERTATSGIPVSFRKKATLLCQAFEKIAQAPDVVQAQPEDHAKPVVELYKQIRQEILRQAESIFNVRTHYSQLGDFDRTRQANEMILLLGDVPGNPCYKMAVVGSQGTRSARAKEAEAESHTGDLNEPLIKPNK